MKPIKRAQPLNQGQFSRLIKITQATSRYAERDVLVLLLGHYCGMRVTEVSRITVADVMQPSGKLRIEISLREAITKGCRQRCAYLVTKPRVRWRPTSLTDWRKASAQSWVLPNIVGFLPISL
jgi:integrase/recombinase XerC